MLASKMRFGGPTVALPHTVCLFISVCMFLALAVSSRLQFFQSIIFLTLGNIITLQLGAAKKSREKGEKGRKWGEKRKMDKTMCVGERRKCRGKSFVCVPNY